MMDISEIVKDKLYMSGSIGSIPWRDKGINVIVNLEEANDAFMTTLFAAYQGVYIHAPFHDESEVKDPSLIRTLAKLVLAFVQQGRRVLVHCSAGLNRSGLVVARVLIEAGYRPVDSVQAVRLCRDPNALCNTVFENWLLKEGPKASVMDTKVIGPDGQEVKE